MSFVWGWLADRIGPKRTLVSVLISWAVGLVIGGDRDRRSGRPGSCPFLIAGAILGSGLGGVQVADRVLMVRLSPPDKIGEFFGIYGLVGKGCQVIGHALYGADPVLLFDSLGNGAYQVAVLSLLVTMLIGLWLVWPVRDDWAGSGEVGDVADGGDTYAGHRAASPAASPVALADPGATFAVRIRPGGRGLRSERSPAQSVVGRSGWRWRHVPRPEPTIGQSERRVALAPGSPAAATSAAAASTSASLLPRPGPAGRPRAGRPS